MVDDTGARPVWDFELTEAQVVKLMQPIDKITKHRRMTSPDTDEQWLEFHSDGRRFRAPKKWESLFRFDPNHRTLIVPAYQGDRACKLVRELEKWDREHKKERAEYERLKAKFNPKP